MLATWTSTCYHHLVSSTDTSTCYHHLVSSTDTSTILSVQQTHRHAIIILLVRPTHRPSCHYEVRQTHHHLVSSTDTSTSCQFDRHIDMLSSSYCEFDNSATTKRAMCILKRVFTLQLVSNIAHFVVACSPGGVNCMLPTRRVWKDEQNNGS